MNGGSQTHQLTQWLVFRVNPVMDWCPLQFNSVNRVEMLSNVNVMVLIKEKAEGLL